MPRVGLAADHRERADDAGHQRRRPRPRPGPRGPGRWRRSPARRAACSRWVTGGHAPSWMTGSGSGTGTKTHPARGRDHEDPPMHPDYVHVLAIQLAEDLGPHHLGGGPAGRPARRQVDEAVHDRQQRVHVVRRDEHRDLLVPGDLAEQFDHILLAGDVQVGQRLVEQEQPGPADQRVGDQYPLLLAAGQQLPTRASPKRSAPTAPSISSTCCARAGRTAAACRAAARPVPGRPGRGRAAACPGRAGSSAGRSRSAKPCRAPRPGPPPARCPPTAACRPRMTRSSVVFPAPFEPIRPVNSPGRRREADVVEDLPAGQPQADARRRRGGRPPGARPPGVARPRPAAPSPQPLGGGLVRPRPAPARVISAIIQDW